MSRPISGNLKGTLAFAGLVLLGTAIMASTVDDDDVLADSIGQVEEQRAAAEAYTDQSIFESQDEPSEMEEAPTEWWSDEELIDDTVGIAPEPMIDTEEDISPDDEDTSLVEETQVVIVPADGGTTD